MAIITTSLSKKIEQINNYLENKIKQELHDPNFFQELKLTIIHCQKIKLKIKFVSQLVDVTQQLQQLSQPKFAEHLSCKVQTVTDITNIDRVIENCDLLCLVRDSHSRISQLDKQLIHKASKTNICQVILDVQKIENNKEIITTKPRSNIHTWLTKQGYNHIQLILLPLHYDENNDLSKQINDYSLVEQLLFIHKTQLEARLNQTFTLKFSQLFTRQKKSIWERIKQKRLYLNNQRQKSHLASKKNQAKQQNKIRKLKEKILQEKITLTNQFSYDSLIYKVSQLVDRSEASLFKENHQQYIHLIIKEENISQRLNTVAIELIQSELDNWIGNNWQEINRIFNASIFTDNEDNLTQNELQSSQKLNEYPHFDEVSLTFDLTNFVSLPLLEENSKIIFDYRFVDSSRFRLSVTVTFSLILYFSTGRLFGFAFVIFQIINFFTGQDFRTKKLKQQTKELKKKLTNQYQSLARFLADRACHTLILAVENIDRAYRDEIDRLTEESAEQLALLKSRINEHKKRLSYLKQDELEILSLLRQNSSSASESKTNM
ncbi:MAG: hypothetical protein AB4368_30905 [Xenococcaceae cyanobacterium]